MASNFTNDLISFSDDQMDVRPKQKTEEGRLKIEDVQPTSLLKQKPTTKEKVTVSDGEDVQPTPLHEWVTDNRQHRQQHVGFRERLPSVSSISGDSPSVDPGKSLSKSEVQSVVMDSLTQLFKTMKLQSPDQLPSNPIVDFLFSTPTSTGTKQVTTVPSLTSNSSVNQTRPTCNTINSNTLTSQYETFTVASSLNTNQQNPSYITNNQTPQSYNPVNPSTNMCSDTHMSHPSHPPPVQSTFGNHYQQQPNHYQQQPNHYQQQPNHYQQQSNHSSVPPWYPLDTRVTLDPQRTSRTPEHPTAYSQITVNPQPTTVHVPQMDQTFNRNDVMSSTPYQQQPSHVFASTHSLYTPSFVGNSSTSTYHKFVKWSIKFDPLQCTLASYLSHFEAHAQLHQYDERQKCHQLLSSLGSEAARILKRLPAQYTYEDLCHAMAVYFEPPENRDAKQLQLRSTVRKPGQSPRDFANCLQDLSDVAYSHLDQNERDTSALRQFIQGQADAITTFLLASRPKTLDEAVNLINMYEASADAKSRQGLLQAGSPLSCVQGYQKQPVTPVCSLVNQTHISTPNINDSHEPEINNLVDALVCQVSFSQTVFDEEDEDQFFDLLMSKVQQKFPSSRSSRVCFYCGTPGHMWVKCLKLIHKLQSHGFRGKSLAVNPQKRSDPASGVVFQSSNTKSRYDVPFKKDQVTVHQANEQSEQSSLNC